MEKYLDAPYKMFSTATSSMIRAARVSPKLSRAVFSEAIAVQYYWNGMFKYIMAFMAPSVNALNSFTHAETEKPASTNTFENLRDYGELIKLNVSLLETSITAGVKAMTGFLYDALHKSISAWWDSLEDENRLCDLIDRREEVLKVLVEEYPKAVEEIKDEFGFHLDKGGYVKVAETERFELYQVLPTQKGVALRRKPILIVPPYVLGANILAFLPAEQKSYVHCFANQGIPTYVRLIKDIDTTEPVQIMTPEDDAVDTIFFCKELMARHNIQVTLNGFCQGGYVALAALLSGGLDGIVDALITCVSPIDGSRSKSLVEFLKSVPPRFREIRYSHKVLPNGNPVIDGTILSWVQKLRKMETESPVASFHRDLSMFNGQAGPHLKIAKTAAALNHWLTHDQKDIPVRISQMSFDSYTIPIDKDGTLPVTLFGRKLNLKRLQEKKIPWLCCIAEGDDLVDKEAALAAMDYIDIEVCVFPKGHASIATSWSIPSSACALHTTFPVTSTTADDFCKLSRGPVRFQLDLDAAIGADEERGAKVENVPPAQSAQIVPTKSTGKDRTAQPRRASTKKVHRKKKQDTEVIN